MYATRAQMEELFGEERLRYLTGGGADIDDGMLDGAIRAAQAEVNGYLDGVLTLPLARVPEALRLHACNIAFYYLDPTNPTEGATARYKAAIRFLERVQDGKASLGTDLEGEPVAKLGGVHVSRGNSTFRDNVDDFSRMR